jgi:hypothetical protein
LFGASEILQFPLSIVPIVCILRQERDLTVRIDPEVIVDGEVCGPGVRDGGRSPPSGFGGDLVSPAFRASPESVRE